MYQGPHPSEAAAAILRIAPGFSAKLGMVLGSGLGGLADSITDAIKIPFDQIPGFPQGNVKGHEGQLILGTLNGLPVACLQGRSHTYETGHYEYVKLYIRTLKLLGCEFFLATNAVGSFHETVPPGSLMMITDHINMQPGNPLVGPNDDEFGPRFPPLDNAYDAELRVMMRAEADAKQIQLHEGVYLAVLGPSYETAAEIRAFRILGADVVGMSTVPEIILAHHCGMRCAVISTITNYVTGLSTHSHDHNEVVAVANQAALQLTNLITAFAGKLRHNA